MIYIVRHGETDYNVEGRYGGRIDVELNAKGIEQAQKIHNELKEIKFDKVISSPLKRAYKTAQIITNFEITKDERIIERCNGELEGKLKEECPQNIDFNDPNTGLGIESILDFRKRIFDFFDEITKEYIQFLYTGMYSLIMTNKTHNSPVYKIIPSCMSQRNGELICQI